jgi:hypothetical protein
MSDERTVRWDGQDLAAVQIATWPLPRRSGRPAAEVTADWDLTINGRFIPTGSVITVTSDRQVRIEAAS